MVAAPEFSVAQRLAQLLRHLNIARTHVAARLPADWGGLAATQPEVFASLTLVCPTAMDAEALRPLAARLLVVTGDQGEPAEVVRGAMTTLPEATMVTLRDYFGHPRADILAERTTRSGRGCWRSWHASSGSARRRPCLIPRKPERSLGSV